MTVLSTIRYPDASLWSLRRRKADPLGFLESLAAHGDFVPFSLARRPAFLLNHPDHVATVLVSEAPTFRKSAANERAKHLLGNGLLTADGALHAERRKLIQPAFGRRRLEDCAAAIVVRAQAAAARWRDGDIVDITDAMGRLTLAIVGDAIIGSTSNAGDLYEDVRRSVDAATESVDPLVSLVAPLRGVRVAQTRLRGIAEQLIRRATGAREGSLLHLLKAHDAGPESQAQRVDDVLTILLAGHDTITSALTWTWLLLSAHPEAEAKMRGELRRVLGRREPSAADLPHLAFTRSVLAESLRLFPPAWVLARHAVQAHRFAEGEVPRGGLVLVSQYLLHRDARYFERPLIFDPDRWLNGKRLREPVSRYSYFPFGAGGRSCIGESFGWMEGVLLLAAIAQRWTLSRVEAGLPPIEARITLRPGSRVLMRAQRSAM